MSQLLGSFVLKTSSSMDFGPRRLAISSPGHQLRAAGSVLQQSARKPLLSALLRLKTCEQAQARRPLPMDMKGVRDGGGHDLPMAGKFELFSTIETVTISFGTATASCDDSGGNDGLQQHAGSSEGCNNTPSINPGSRNDQLHLVTQNSYGGHRIQRAASACVLNDGSNYMPTCSHLLITRHRLPALTKVSAPPRIAEYIKRLWRTDERATISAASGDRNVRRLTLNSKRLCAGSGDADGDEFSQPLGRFSRQDYVAVFRTSTTSTGSW